MLRERYPNICLIENKVNSGFTGGNNIVIDYAIKNNADYVWLLNNDTVVDVNSLFYLVEECESSNLIGMASPVIYYYSDPSKKQFSGSYFDWANYRICYPDLSVEINDKYLSGHDVCLWGTALLIKSETIKHIGNLKLDYFAYWEDTEYSLRSIKSGYQNVVVPKSTIFHKTPIVGTRKSINYHYLMVRNKLLMLEEYQYISNRHVFYWKQFAELIRGNASLVRENNVEYANARVNGYLDAFKHLKGPINVYQYPVLNKVILQFSKYYPYFIANILLGNGRLLIEQIWRKISRIILPVFRSGS